MRLHSRKHASWEKQAQLQAVEDLGRFVCDFRQKTLHTETGLITKKKKKVCGVYTLNILLYVWFCLTCKKGTVS